MIHSKNPTFAVFTLNSSRNPEHDVLCGLSNQAKKQGWNLLIFNALDSFDVKRPSVTERCIFRLADTRTISGVFITQNVMNMTDVSTEIIMRYKSLGIPVISLGYKTDLCYSVVYDDDESFENLIDHVIEKHGCKVLHLVAGMKNNIFSQHRIDAFKLSLQKHNLPFDEKRMCYGEFWREPTEKAMDEFFKSKMPLPDAFICCNDEMAITVCERLAEKNIKVPEDVIVTGYDGTIFAELNAPQITTAKCELDRIGVESAKLMKKIFSDEKIPRFKSIPARQIFSESCGCKFSESRNYRKFSQIMQEQIETYTIMNVMQQNMVTTVASVTKISEIKDYLPDREYFGGDIWVMINHSYKDLFFKQSAAQTNPFDPKMDCFFCSINWNIYNYPSVKRTNYIPEIDAVLDNSFSTLVFSPITFGEEIFGYCAYPFTKERTSISKYERFAQTIGQCFALVRNREQTTYMLERDLMTGSYNRRGFYSNLKKKIEKLGGRKSYLIVHSIDMDNLKSINDTFGHSAGDFAIKSLARAVNFAAGKNAITARFGGDEFVSAVLITKQPENFEKDFKNKLEGYIANINKGSGKPFFVSASCGSQMAQIKEFNDTIIDGLMKNADNSMYKDKNFRKRNQPRQL